MAEKYEVGREDVKDAEQWRKKGTSWLWDRQTSFLGRVYMGLLGRKKVEGEECRVNEIRRMVRPDDFEERIQQELPKSSGFHPKDREHILKKQEKYFFKYREGNGKTALNVVVVGLGAMLGKVYMNVMNTTTCFDAEKLTEQVFLKPYGRREKGRGLLTVANHKSVVDDPFLLGALTPWYLPLRPRNVRWGTCASDMCFTHRAFEFAMRALKVLPVVRFHGIDLPEMNYLIGRLRQGEWVNYFPEGRISQKRIDRVRRGVGKIICEAGKSEHGLTVVPMYHQGLEDLMPHTKSNQLISFLPRVGKRVWAIVGDPVEIDDLVQKARNCKGDDCLKIYEQVADRIAVAIRLLRSDLRRKAAEEYGVYLGDPYQVSDDNNK